MRDFDTTIKLLILDSAELLRQLGVEHVATWLNVELPKVQNRRAEGAKDLPSSAVKWNSMRKELKKEIYDNPLEGL